MRLEDIHRHAKIISQSLRLKTYPMAIKMLKGENEIPEGATRPLKEIGKHLDLCQAFAMTRWEGKTMALFKEDMWCFEPVVGYGLAEAPKEFLEGRNRYPATAKTLEAGGEWAQACPRMELGAYRGIVSAPLSMCNFMPDMFMLYCDPSQLTHLLIAVNWIDGGDITTTLSGHAGCVHSVVPVLKHKQFWVASPCQGDRRIAATQDTELIFSGPIEDIDDLVEAFGHLEGEWKYPWKPYLQYERELNDNYAELGRKMGMDHLHGK